MSCRLACPASRVVLILATFSALSSAVPSSVVAQPASKTWFRAGVQTDPKTQTLIPDEDQWRSAVVMISESADQKSIEIVLPLFKDADKSTQKSFRLTGAVVVNEPKIDLAKPVDLSPYGQFKLTTYRVYALQIPKLVIPYNPPDYVIIAERAHHVDSQGAPLALRPVDSVAEPFLVTGDIFPRGVPIAEAMGVDLHFRNNLTNGLEEVRP